MTDTLNRPDTLQEAPAVTMRVRKRDGSYAPVDPDRITTAVRAAAAGLSGVDPDRVAETAIRGLYDGVTTAELDALSIRSAAALIAEEPNYSKLAARLLTTTIDKEVANQGIGSFSESITAGWRCGLIGDTTFDLVRANAARLDTEIVPTRSKLFEWGSPGRPDTDFYAAV